MKIVIYTTQFCPFCIRAKYLLNELSLTYQEIPVDRDPQLRQEMANKAGVNTVPQIWFGEEHIGGCDELFYRYRQGTLGI